MGTINEFISAMYEEDKKLIGKELTDISIEKANAIIYTLTSNFKAKSISKGNVIYVVDNNENVYVIPDLYEQYIETYGLTKMYFEDMKPKMYQVSFNYQNEFCTIYLIVENDEDYTLLCNDAAKKVIKTLDEQLLAKLISNNVILAKVKNSTQNQNKKLYIFEDGKMKETLNPLYEINIIDENKKMEIYKIIAELPNIENMNTEENSDIVTFDLWYYDQELETEYTASIHVSKDKEIYLNNESAHIISMFNVRAFKFSFINAVGEKLEQQSAKTRKI